MAAEIPDGAFIVARAIFNSSLWTMRKEIRLLAITCIGLANWKPKKIWVENREVLVNRGCFLRSLPQLCEASRLTIKEVRTSLNHLIRAGFLARERAGLSYVYTVCKYDRYQDLTKYADSEWPERAGKRAGKRAGNGQGTGRMRAVNNNTKNGMNLKKGRKRASPAPVAALLKKAQDRAIPNNDETVKRYLRAWVARSSVLEVEKILDDEWTDGKTVIEIQDHFWPKAIRGSRPGFSVSDSNGKTKCLTCGGTKKTAGEVRNGMIELVDCPRCTQKVMR